MDSFALAAARARQRRQRAGQARVFGSGALGDVQGRTAGSTATNSGASSSCPTGRSTRSNPSRRARDDARGDPPDDTVSHLPGAARSGRPPADAANEVPAIRPGRRRTVGRTFPTRSLTSSLAGRSPGRTAFPTRGQCRAPSRTRAAPQRFPPGHRQGTDLATTGDGHRSGSCRDRPGREPSASSIPLKSSTSLGSLGRVVPSRVHAADFRAQLADPRQEREAATGRRRGRAVASPAASRRARRCGW